MSDNESKFLPEQRTLIQDYAREYIQVMRTTKNGVGHSEGDTSKHFSFPNRYNEIARLINVGYEVKPELEELRELINQTLTQNQSIRIRESAVGEGAAIVNFLKNLKALPGNNRFEIYLNGLYQPRETIIKTFLEEIDELSTGVIQIKEFAIRDLKDINKDEETDIFILSNVHQYLTEDQFISAVENALEYSKIIAIHPIVGNANFPDTLYIYKTEKGEIKRVIQERTFIDSKLGYSSAEN
jgi:hypothetical protein